MVEVVFDFEQNQTFIQSNLTDSLETIITRFISKTKLDLNEIYFLSNGKNINTENKETIENIMTDSEKISKKKVILVYYINNQKNTNIIKSNDIICPTCKELCKYELKNHKIKLSGCKNGHIKENIKLEEFNSTQGIDISLIKCDKCKNITKSDAYNHDFFTCIECNMNLCPLCNSIHDKAHSIINYENKNYFCSKHSETFVKYCEECLVDLCFSCINEHKNHKVINYEEKIIDIKNLRKKMNELKDVINKFKINLESIIIKLKKLEDNLDMFYSINNDIVNNYEKNKNKNYKVLINLNSIKDSINKELDKLKDDYNYGFNLNSLLYLYTEINDKNLEIEINYKKINNNEEKLKIFGGNFVNNNVNKCKIIYKGKEYDLTKYLEDIDEKYNPNDIISLKLKGFNNVTDMCNMFAGCNSLYSFPDISNWNTSNIINMCGVFDGCNLLSSLPDISKWDTSNVEDMCGLFLGCSALTTLPNISNWNTKNVTTMYGMFYKCKSLIALPYISNWDTSKVNDMSLMFYGCDSLTALPDISKWNTSNVSNMYAMFYECKSLCSLPDISMWDTTNVTNMGLMFHGTKPDLEIPSKFKK